LVKKKIQAHTHQEVLIREIADSSRFLTLRMEGGLKRRELEESVPRRDLLGVSGWMRDWSPPDPNITLCSEAGVLHLLASAFRAP